MKVVTQGVLGLGIVAAIVAGGVYLVRTSNTGGGIEITLPTPTSVAVEVLKVHISGAVQNPGVYQVEDGDRLEDVVAAAGGATAEADLASVNLAVRVNDEEHWHIPVPGESPSAEGSSGTGAPAVRAEGAKIDLNSATAEELIDLPGIGEVKAEAIVRYRASNGPFSSVDEVTAVQGIGPATLEAISELVEAR